MQEITGEIAADVVRSVVDPVVGTEGLAAPAVSIAVVDDAGALVAFQRMTGVPRFSADFAIAKARTAAAFATETSRLEELYADRPVFAHSFVAQGGYFLGRGGVPIVVDGAVVGAIGVSGADAHGEEDMARSAATRAAALAEGRLGEEGGT
jgi:glc operon protein GlcG